MRVPNSPGGGVCQSPVSDKAFYVECDRVWELEMIMVVFALILSSSVSLSNELEYFFRLLVDV